MALGAARRRVIRQLLTESLLLAAVAGVTSVLLAPVLARVVMQLLDQRLPATSQLTPDGTLLTYATVISVIAALAFGLAPAFRSTRVSVGETLKGHTARATGRFRLEGVLIGIQAAVSVALLLAAGLLLRGVDRARSLDPGFRTDGVTALKVQLPRNSYDRARQRAFFDDLLPVLQSGGARVGMASLLPLGDAMNFTDFKVPGASADAGAVAVEEVTSGYLARARSSVSCGTRSCTGSAAASRCTSRHWRQTARAWASLRSS
jgi:hypothetical protein